MRGQLLQAPAQPRTTSLWLSLAAAKKETFQNGLVAAPQIPVCVMALQVYVGENVVSI